MDTSRIDINLDDEKHRKLMPLCSLIYFAVVLFSDVVIIAVLYLCFKNSFKRIFRSKKHSINPQAHVRTDQFPSHPVIIIESSQPTGGINSMEGFDKKPAFIDPNINISPPPYRDTSNLNEK
ncbi:hypothetical protein HZS_2593 [Henneguya salminicola]|nr:hypothetical protein HZS_2593 [Henneguya salminicola]